MTAAKHLGAAMTVFGIAGAPGVWFLMAQEEWVLGSLTLVPVLVLVFLGIILYFFDQTY